MDDGNGKQPSHFGLLVLAVAIVCVLVWLFVIL